METYKILEAVVGSRAYGLAHDYSDTDTLGVFVAPTVEIAGLNWYPSMETHSGTSPEHDFTEHEVAKAVKLLMANNPVMVELLFFGEEGYIDYTHWGEELIYLSRALLYTSKTRAAFIGYAHNQWMRYNTSSDSVRQYKTVRTALRIAREGIQLLTTGTINPVVDDPREYWDLEWYPKDDVTKKIGDAMLELSECSSVLPDEPDHGPINDYIRRIRRQFLG